MAYHHPASSACRSRLPIPLERGVSMSNEAVKWALTRQVGDTTAKFVLVLLAYRATAYHDDRYTADVVVEDLARDAETDSAAVMRAFAVLEAAGLVERRPAAAPAPAGRFVAILNGGAA